jgi:RNA-binding protein
MSLTEEQRRALRGKAHKLKPVVMLGKAGLTEPVLAEINAALDFHELIKVKVRDDDREARRATIADLATRSGAELLQVIGQIAVLFRATPEKKSPPRAKPQSRQKPARDTRRPGHSGASHRSDVRGGSARREFAGSGPTSRTRSSGAGRRRPGPGRQR